MTKYRSNQSYKSYKSIDILPEFELPDFVVLTGLNGSGKTHLLEMFKDGKILRINSDGSETTAPAKLFDMSQEEPPQEASTLTQIYFRMRANSSMPVLDPVVRETAVFYGKKPEDITDQDIIDYSDSYYQRKNIFQVKLASIFNDYNTKLFANEFNRYLKYLQIPDAAYLEEPEFIKKYGEPPWGLVNKILGAANLDYEVIPPSKLELTAAWIASPNRVAFGGSELTFKNKLNNVLISFGELSSGEKVIVSLAVTMYKIGFGMVSPEILLMDEPDASLHPSMTKQFLDVIQKVFVEEKGIKVIMTTHSPSTVALAPEEAIFLMRQETPRIIKVSKDKALNSLSVGVPTLSVKYENRRQVYVESDYDRAFYETVYEKLLPYSNSEISLSFTSSGVGGAGNCDQVKQQVDTLRKLGNTTVLGIIDWDGKNNRNDHVKTLGLNRRYSLENYAFDPLLLSIYFFFKKWITREELGLKNNESFTDFKNFTDSQLQSIVDYVMGKISSGLVKPDISTLRCKYVNEIELDLPKWFLEMKGHNIFVLLKVVYKGLNGFGKGDTEEERNRTGENMLRKEILENIIDDLPGFIPNDIRELFESIQSF